ncbi:YciI family protein [Kutzneria sp. CA-103260]|uniref:YciI family protein n=1 Tax=Kutzneria sp. CA-103260 TaxID=2802641 RepID=UPI001BACB29E|nr:YciI family protein [Kutzneria sp. CA-103260]QUQ64923.1 DGPF domain-containing protein [Kutzneria sp. CA-103260]
MKYLLMIYMNDETWAGLSAAERDAVMAGHDEFQRITRETGELLNTHALGSPSTTAVVRVRDGEPVVTDGPFLEAKEYLAGYYLMDCESRERAVELAGMIPDARYSATEVWPVMFSSGVDV